MSNVTHVKSRFGAWDTGGQCGCTGEISDSGSMPTFCQHGNAAAQREMCASPTLAFTGRADLVGSILELVNRPLWQWSDADRHVALWNVLTEQEPRDD